MINAIEFESSVEYDLYDCDFGCEFLKNFQIIESISSSPGSSIFKIERFRDGAFFTLKAIRHIENIQFDIAKLTGLDHPGLARIIHHGHSKNYQYIIKPYIDGVTLRQFILSNGPMNEMMVKRVANQLIDVFEYLHSRPEPFIFRDLKPANIVVTPEFQIVLIDLETMRQTRDEQASDTFYVGTHGYASPEQYGYKQSDERSDIYTIGATLYFLLTGLEPTINIKKLKSITEINHDLSSQMASIISTCMAFNPEDRFKNVGAIRKALAKKHHVNPRIIRGTRIGISALLVLMILFSFRHMALDAMVDFVKESGYIEPEVVTIKPEEVDLSPIQSTGNEEEDLLLDTSVKRVHEKIESAAEVANASAIEPEPPQVLETQTQPEAEIEPILEPVQEDAIASVTVPIPGVESESEPIPEPTTESEIVETNHIFPVDQEHYLSIPDQLIFLRNRNGVVSYRLENENIIFKFELDAPPELEWNTLFLMEDTPGLYQDFNLPEGTLSFLVSINLNTYMQFEQGIIVGFGNSHIGVINDFRDYLKLY